MPAKISSSAFQYSLQNNQYFVSCFRAFNSFELSSCVENLNSKRFIRGNKLTMNFKPFFHRNIIDIEIHFECCINSALYIASIINHCHEKTYCNSPHLYDCNCGIELKFDPHLFIDMIAW